MEKDYFKDRPIESTKIKSIKIGTEVYICTKMMQPCASELNDLSRGVVNRVLTKHDHPRGIKCEIIQSCNGMKLVGRVVYIVNDNLILTKNGLKDKKDVNILN